MTPKEQARLRKTIEGMTPEELTALHSQSIIALELIWGAVEARLCGSREHDACPRALASAKAGAMKFKLKSFHREADALAGEVASIPVAAAGSR